MAIEVIGWDIGGAHLKAVALDSLGQVLAVAQEPCPLWQGLQHLHAALDRILANLEPGPACRHAVTMTGELADCFPDRVTGVAALVKVMVERCPSVALFVGTAEFLPAEDFQLEHAARIASANWLASGLWTAANLREALFVDIGSTTTDILPVCDHTVNNRGYTDYERMRYDELVYTGVVRTSLMAVADRAPFAGEWIGLMAEHFATMADVYRVTCELPEAADQHPSADGGDKTVAGSIRRLARLFGRDGESAPPERWLSAARFFRERQLARLSAGIERQLSRGLISETAPWVGAGVGRFLVRELAARARRPYVDFSDLLSMSIPRNEFRVADCAPAAAVAGLALREVNRK